MTGITPPSAGQGLIAREGARSGLLWRVLPLTGYCLAVLYFGTSRDSVVSNATAITSDKVLHALVFGGLGVLAYRASSYFWPSRRRLVHAAVAVLWSAFFGGLLELVQSFTTYRSAELGDFVADIIGALVLVFLAAKLRIERSLRLPAP